MNLGCIDSPYDIREHIYENLPFSTDNRVSNGLVRKFELQVDEAIWQYYTCWCVAFATAHMMYCDSLTRFGKGIKFSQEYIMKHAKDRDTFKSSKGTTLTAALDGIIANGACPYDMLPFHADSLSVENKFMEITAEMITEGKKYRDKSYAKVDTVEGLKDAILNQNGAIASLSIFKNYEGIGDGFIHAPIKDFKEEPTGNHCVFFCGFDDDFEHEVDGVKHKGFFKILESDRLESTSNGFRYLAYDHFKATGHYTCHKLVREVYTTYSPSQLLDPEYHKKYFISSKDVIDPKRDIIILVIGNKVATINGEKKTLSIPPEIIDGVTYVPLRFVGEAFKQTYVNWSNATKEITVVNQRTGKRFIFKIGSLDVKDASGNVVYHLLQAPIIKNGSTLIPLRAVSECLGARVGWDGPTKTITIEK